MLSVGGREQTELAVACTDQARLTDAYRQLVKRYDVQDPRSGHRGHGRRRPGVARAARAVALTTRAGRARGGRQAAGRVADPAGGAGRPDRRRRSRGPGDAGGRRRAARRQRDDDGLRRRRRARPRTCSACPPRRWRRPTSSSSDLYLRLGVQLTSPQVWSRIGATPMIGQNDVDAERFTVDDARGLATFAVDKGLGRVSMWSLNRDAAVPRHLHQRRRALQHVQRRRRRTRWPSPSVFAGLPGKRGRARPAGNRSRSRTRSRSSTTRRPARTRCGA